MPSDAQVANLLLGLLVAVAALVVVACVLMFAGVAG